MKKIIGLLLFLVLIFYSHAEGLCAEPPSAEERFLDANRAYQEGRFQDAIDGYLRLIADGYKNGHLYYNLGNAYFRTDQLGRAILNYERAYLQMPRDADLNFNLRYALDRTQDAISPARNYLGQAFFWLDEMTFHELLWAFSVLNLFFWGILLLRLFRRPEWSYYGFIVLLIFWLVVGASSGLKWHQIKTDHRVVVLPEEVDVLAGPDAKDTVLFKLHAGAIVNQERNEYEWSLIRLSDEKRGWVKSSGIEKITG